MGKTEKSKAIEYAVMIQGAIANLFEEDGIDGLRIELKELAEDNNMTEFIHALSNVVPTHFYNYFTGESKNHLEFNHIANQLCFQYSNRVEEEAQED